MRGAQPVLWLVETEVMGHDHDVKQATCPFERRLQPPLETAALMPPLILGSFRWLNLFLLVTRSTGKRSPTFNRRSSPAGTAAT